MEGTNKAAVEKMLHNFLGEKRWEKVLEENEVVSSITSIICFPRDSEYKCDEHSLPTAPNPFEQQEIIRL